jgi:Fe-S cluster biogenesis protein NfuA/nitrite reductase/ring-hydroxylating ferredoxin subunit
MATADSGDQNLREPRLTDLVRDIERLEQIIAGWDVQQQATLTAFRRALDELNKEAFRRLIRTVKAEPQAVPALRQAVTDEVVYSVLRHHELIKASLQERLETALDSVRPSLASHGGDVELIALVPPDTVEIRLLGTCDGCPASALTLSLGIEKAIKDHCPEITTIKKASAASSGTSSTAGNFVSPFARNDDPGWIYATEFSAIPEGDILLLDLDGHALLLSRFGERVSCFENACAHLGLGLEMGEVRDGTIICPHHGFQYSLASGECYTAPQVQLQAHPVRVRGHAVDVRLRK